MRKYQLGSLCLLTLSLLPAAATVHAADDMTLDPLIISARGHSTSLTQTPGGVAVLEADEFAGTVNVSIADILAKVPGISLTGDSPWGQDVSIRGLTGASIIVLIDGKRINTATDINARLGLISSKDIDRVEVLKGPVSALYGSGSTGGVINIITRKGSFQKDGQLHGRVSQSVSTNPGGYDGYLNLHYDTERYWLFGSGAFRDFGDTWAGGNQRIPNSKFSDWQGRFSGGFKPTPHVTLELQALRLEAQDVGIPGGPSTLPAQARVTYPKTTNELYSIDAKYESTGTAFKELQASLYYNLIKRRVLVDQIPTGTVRKITPEADHATIGGKTQALFKTAEHTIVTGIDGWNWDMQSTRYRYLNNGNILKDAPVPRADQTSIGFFIEDDWKLNQQFTLNTGGRLDYLETSNEAGNSFAKDTKNDLGWNLHAGLNWNMSKEWSQSLLVASSYRAADILERYKYINLSGGQVLYGTPGLKPEQSLYSEYAVHLRTKPLKADVRLFFNEIHNLIAEKRINATRLEMSNIGKARIYGAEIEGTWRFYDQWSLSATVAALKGRDESKDQALRGVAPVSGTAGIDYTTKNWWARVDTRWAADQSDTPPDVARTKAYATLNASTGITFTAFGLDQELNLNVTNILDSKYRNYLANSRGIVLHESGLAASLTYSVEF